MEEFRLQYPLGASSLVMDAGAYRGDYVAWCRGRWGCRVYAFEPCRSFHAEVLKRFPEAKDANGSVRVFDYGLAGRTESVALAVQGDATSIYLEHAAVTEVAQFRDVVEVFAELGLTGGADHVDLFKINIEGGEYALLPRMLDADVVKYVRYFQVQYHSIGAGHDGPAAERERIRDRLSISHKEEWFVNGGQWESWALR